MGNSITHYVGKTIMVIVFQNKVIGNWISYQLACLFLVLETLE